MDPVQAGLGRGRDDGERHEPRLRAVVVHDGRVAPELVEARQAGARTVGALGEERLPTWPALGVGGGRRDLPLVPAARRHEAAPARGRRRVGRSVQQRLRPSVDHARPAAGILGPAGDEPPGEQAELALGPGVAGVLARGPPGEDDRGLLRRGHVVVRSARRGLLGGGRSTNGPARRPVDIDLELLDELARGWPWRHSGHTWAEHYAARDGSNYGRSTESPGEQMTVGTAAAAAGRRARGPPGVSMADPGWTPPTPRP